MTTQAQITANHRNAAKSTGPKTTVGKAIVAQNAIKHGLFAHQDVIAEEDPQQYEAHRQRLLGELSPGSEMETILSGRIVSLTWRLQRAERLQNELFDYLLAKEIESSLGHFYSPMTDKDQERMRGYVDTDPAYAVGRMIAKDYRGEKTLDRLTMHERRIEGSLYRTMNELRRTRASRKADGGQSPPYKSEPADEGGDCAKQSQSEEVSSGAGSASAHDPVCETKPMDPAEAVCSVPARASEETPCRVTASVSACAMERGPVCETKPMQGSVKCEVSSVKPEDCTLPLQTSNVKLHTSPETPCGVTTNSGACCAKQSQIPGAP